MSREAPWATTQSWLAGEDASVNCGRLQSQHPHQTQLESPPGHVSPENANRLRRVIVRQVRVASGGCRGLRLADGSPCFASVDDAPSINQEPFGPDKRWKFSRVGQGTHWGALGSFYSEQGHRIFMPRCSNPRLHAHARVLQEAQSKFHTPNSFCPF